MIEIFEHFLIMNRCGGICIMLKIYVDTFEINHESYVLNI